MKVAMYRTDFYHLENKLNEIGYEKVLQIIPDHVYNSTLYIIVYRADAEVKYE